MAQPGDIFLGPSGAEICMEPYGRTFRRSIREGAREDRTVNGRLIKDIKWRKWEFSLNYSLCSGTQLQVFEQLWDLQTELSFRWVDNLRGEETYTVQMKSFDKTRLSTAADGLWKGVNVTLLEV